MEHRVPPRPAAEDHSASSVAPASRGPLALPPPLDSQIGRHAFDRRRAIRALAIFSSVVLGSWLGYRTMLALHGWLGEQPAYQVPFASIVLDPPPPPWYRGGSAGFLEDVRRRAWKPETVPVLKLESEDLKYVFQQSPWTEEVVKVSYPPGGITVSLRYRRPVALVEISERERYLVDASAVLLPLEDLDGDPVAFVKEQTCMRIRGKGLVGPAKPQPGLTWQPKAGVVDLAPGNDQIPSAAGLARFLIDKMREVDLEKEPGLNITDINPIDPRRLERFPKGRGLFLWNVESTYIFWREAPGEEASGSMKAEEKWAKLREWSRKARTRTLPEHDYWDITPDGVIPRGPESARLFHPARDRSTIRAKATGQSPHTLSH